MVNLVLGRWWDLRLCGDFFGPGCYFQAQMIQNILKGVSPEWLQDLKQKSGNGRFAVKSVLERVMS